MRGPLPSRKKSPAPLSTPEYSLLNQESSAPLNSGTHSSQPGVQCPSQLWNTVFSTRSPVPLNSGITVFSTRNRVPLSAPEHSLLSQESSAPLNSGTHSSQPGTREVEQAFPKWEAQPPKPNPRFSPCQVHPIASSGRLCCHAGQPNSTPSQHFRVPSFPIQINLPDSEPRFLKGTA